MTTVPRRRIRNGRQAKGPVPFLVFGAIFAVVGVALLAAAAAVTLNTRAFLASAERVDGTVIGVEKRVTQDSDDRRRTSVTWCSQVEYVAEQQPHEFTSSSCSSPPRHDVGDTVTVAYAPDDPSDARLADSGSYVGPLIMGPLGLLFAGVGTSVLVVTMRRRRRARAGTAPDLPPTHEAKDS